jgi:hypothetical protein
MIPKGARAVALLPAASGEQIPIRILDVPQERRKHIEEILRRNITEIELVGQDKTARFLVDLKGTELRLLAMAWRWWPRFRLTTINGEPVWPLWSLVQLTHRNY